MACRFWRRLWRWRSPRTAAPGGAAAVPNVRFPFFPMFRSSLFLPFPLFSQSVFLSSVFFLCFSLHSVSLFFRFFLSLSSVFFCFSPSSSPLFSPFFLHFFPLLLSAFLGSIYRGQGRCFFLQLSWGAAGWSAIGRGCRGSVGGARWVVGHCVRSVGSRRESGRQKFKLKQNFFLLPRCVIRGRR